MDEVIRIPASATFDRTLALPRGCAHLNILSSERSGGNAHRRWLAAHPQPKSSTLSPEDWESSTYEASAQERKAEAPAMLSIAVDFSRDGTPLGERKLIAELMPDAVYRVNQCVVFVPLGATHARITGATMAEGVTLSIRS